MKITFKNLREDVAKNFMSQVLEIEGATALMVAINLDEPLASIEFNELKEGSAIWLEIFKGGSYKSYDEFHNINQEEETIDDILTTLFESFFTSEPVEELVNQFEKEKENFAKESLKIRDLPDDVRELAELRINQELGLGYSQAAWNTNMPLVSCFSFSKTPEGYAAWYAASQGDFTSLRVLHNLKKV